MTRIIPVLDVKAGQAVHALAGRRAHYQPLRSRLHEGFHPIDLALAFRNRLGFRELYLADLDAIDGAPPSLSLYRAIQALGLSLWVDAGIRGPGEVSPLFDAGVATVIVGLETIRGPDALEAIVERFGPDRIVFSLDLREGRPVLPSARRWGNDGHDAIAIADKAIRCGVTRLLVLDLARVGTGTGTGSSALIKNLRVAHPPLELIAGGGISGPDDLGTLERAGASAVLIGSALHDGRMTPDLCRRANLEPRSSEPGLRLGPDGANP